MNSKTECSKQDCTNEKYVAPTSGTKSSWCSEHINEYKRDYYASRPGHKAAENLRYFTAHEGHTYLNTKDGYWYQLGISHAASNPSGNTPVHRIVLWEKLDGEDALCAECGGEVRWFWKDPAFELHVDHVDGNKQNNDPSNLEPVHLGCNVKRAHRMRKAKKAAALAAGEAA